MGDQIYGQAALSSWLLGGRPVGRSVGSVVGRLAGGWKGWGGCLFCLMLWLLSLLHKRCGGEGSRPSPGAGLRCELGRTGGGRGRERASAIALQPKRDGGGRAEEEGGKESETRATGRAARVPRDQRTAAGTIARGTCAPPRARCCRRRPKGPWRPRARLGREEVSRGRAPPSA